MWQTSDQESMFRGSTDSNMEISSSDLSVHHSIVSLSPLYMLSIMYTVIHCSCVIMSSAVPVTSLGIILHQDAYAFIASVIMVFGMNSASTMAAIALPSNCTQSNVMPYCVLIAVVGMR